MSVDFKSEIDFVDLVKKSISEAELDPKFLEKGFILDSYDGVAKVSFIDNAFLNEVVLINNEIRGVIIEIKEHFSLITIIDDSAKVKEGDEVTRTGEELKIKVGISCLGRVLNGVGDPVDGLGEIKSDHKSSIEVNAPGIMDRQSVHESLHTGITAVDALIPIGRGQRELIIGDRKTGKTTIAIDTILNQAKINETLPEKERVYSIYVAIGQRNSSVARIVEMLKNNNAMQYTTVVSACASDSAILQYFSPYVGCAIGEHFRDNGMHAVIVYDDLSKHAAIYRQISLLLKRPPGREAYPGDAFYIHSKLLERAAKLSNDKGAGSLTALPIIETQANDVSGYIPTNVISITDGQIFLESELFLKGNLPAINIGLSVSRVGSMAQSKIMKKIAGTLKLDLSQFREIEAFSQFASDLDPETIKIIAQGEKIVKLLQQNAHQVMPEIVQIYLLYTVYNGLIEQISLSDIEKFKRMCINDCDRNINLEYKNDEGLSSIFKKLESNIKGIIEKINLQK